MTWNSWKAVFSPPAVAVVAAPAVVAEDDGLHRVQLRQVLLGLPDLVVVQAQAAEAPEAVAAPGVEGAVVAQLLDARRMAAGCQGTKRAERSSLFGSAGRHVV